LDRERLIDALRREGIDDLGAQAEVSECGHVSPWYLYVVSEADPRDLRAETDEGRPRVPAGWVGPEPSD
jgi:hypothetical protein